MSTRIPIHIAAPEEQATRMETVFTLVGCVLFFLMLFVPTVYQPAKGLLLVCLLLAIAVDAVRKRGELGLDRTLVSWTLVMSFTGLFFCFLGVLRGGAGSVPSMRVMALWPLVYLLLMAGVRSNRILGRLEFTLWLALASVSLYSASFILHSIGLWPDALYFELDQGQSIEFYEGYVEFNLYSISSLLYLVPFGISALLVPREDGEHRASWGLASSATRIGGWVIVILALLVSVASGRRALLLILAVSPFVTLYFVGLLPTVSRRALFRVTLRWSIVIALVGSGVFGVLFMISGVEWSAVRDMFLAGFDAAGNVDGSARMEQAYGLISEWMKRPLLGSGFGVALDALVIADDPWSYELQYLSMLANTGLVGIALYGTAVVWLYRNAIDLIGKGGPLAASMVSVMTGTTCFLLATATNQYIAKFDFVWVIFLPLMFINRARLDGAARS